MTSLPVDRLNANPSCQFCCCMAVIAATQAKGGLVSSWLENTCNVACNIACNDACNVSCNVACIVACIVACNVVYNAHFTKLISFTFENPVFVQSTFVHIRNISAVTDLILTKLQKQAGAELGQAQLTTGTRLPLINIILIHMKCLMCIT